MRVWATLKKSTLDTTKESVAKKVHKFYLLVSFIWAFSHEAYGRVANLKVGRASHPPFLLINVKKKNEMFAPCPTFFTCTMGIRVSLKLIIGPVR